MLNQIPLPILADIEDYVWLAILIVTGIIGLLNNLFAGKNQQQPPARGGRPRPPARRPAQAGGDRISDEIEIFLEQITGKKTVKKKPRQAASAERPHRPDPSRKKPAQAPQPQKRKRVRPGSQVAKRKISDSSQLGGDIRSHVSEHMEAGRISDQVATHLDHDVNEGVQQHLGAFGGEDAGGFGMIEQRRGTSAGTRQIIDLLRDPNGVRQAILINEILSPPKGRQRRS